MPLCPPLQLMGAVGRMLTVVQKARAVGSCYPFFPDIVCEFVTTFGWGRFWGFSKSLLPPLPDRPSLPCPNPMKQSPACLFWRMTSLTAWAAEQQLHQAVAVALQRSSSSRHRRRPAG